MRHRAAGAGIESLPAESRLVGALPCCEGRRCRSAPPLELDLVDVEDIRRPLGRLAVRERRHLGLAVPGIVDPPLDPLPSEPERPRARRPARVYRVMPRPEREQIEPVRAGHERVLELVRPMDDAVAGPNLVYPVVLPREAGPRRARPKISSEAPCEWGGVGNFPGATRTRFSPTPFVPAASRAAAKSRPSRPSRAGAARRHPGVQSHPRRMMTP